MQRVRWGSTWKRFVVGGCVIAGAGVLAVCRAPGAREVEKGEGAIGVGDGTGEGTGKGEGGENAGGVGKENGIEREGPPLPVDAGSADGSLLVSLGRCEGAGCELVFHFSRPMVESRDAEPPAIEMEPPQEGTFHWRSARELVFSPAEGALFWGQKVTVRLARAVPLAGEAHALAKPLEQTLRVPYFRAAGKVAAWPVVPGKPRFVALLDGYERALGKGAKYLLYDQPVDPREIGRFIRLSSGGQRLPVEVFRPKSIARVWSGKVDTSTIVAVRGKRFPEDGASVELQYPARLDGEIPDIDDVQLTVRTSLDHVETALARATAGGRAPLQARIHLRFSGAVGAQEAEERIRIRPEPEQMSLWSWGGQVQVSVRLSPGKAYRLLVSGALEDTLGNRLGRRVVWRFRAQDLAPRLALPAKALVLERGRARVPLRATNVERAALTLHRFSDPLDFVRAHARGAPASCDAVSKAAAATRTFGVKREAELNRASRPEVDLGRAAGLACLDAVARGRGSEAQEDQELKSAALVQLTDLGVTAKVHAGGIAAWVTSLSKAEPIGGAKVALVDPGGAVLARGKTDEGGLAELSGAGVTGRGGLSRRAYLVAEAGGEAAAIELDEKRLAQPWQFGLEGEVESAAPLTASLFSDRGVYRPEEKVHLAFVVREPAPGGGLRVPGERALDVEVADARGKEIYREKVRLDRFGVGEAELELPAGAAVGEYAVRARRGDRVASTSFRVEEYRVPTFEVKVSSESERWRRGKKARALVEARYLHGGELSGRPVEYSVSRVPEKVKAPGLEGFVFRDPEVAAPAGRIAAGDGRLDGQGRLALAFVADHPAKAGPMRYVVNASVTDVDRQAYAGRLSRTVHPAGVYVGIKPPAREVLRAGDTLQVPVVAVSPDGERKAGVGVTLRLESIRYHTVARLAGEGAERRNRAVARPIKRCRVRTEMRPVSCRLRVGRAGYYRVVAETGGRAGRGSRSAFKVTFGGERRISWPRFGHERIEVIADKARYRPGDTARLMVKSPFKRARGILTVEQGAIVEHESFEIKGDSPVLEVPIRKGHAPNVYASVVLLRGRIHGRRDATGFETGAPAFRIGYADLEVEPSFARLDVEVAPEAEIAHPGRALAIDLEVRDAEGRPRAGRAVVMVVDEAVLGLTGYQTPDPLSELFAHRALGIRTASSRLDLLSSRRERREAIFPGGGGGPGFGAGIEELGPDVRDVFASTAFFDAGVRVGSDGRARVKVDLPDNVTTFRVMAVAVDGGTRAGAGEAKVVVRKPVMVQAAAPRFVYPGDTVRIDALVHNGTDKKGTARIAAGFSGLDPAGEVTKRGSVEPGGQAVFSFPVRVTGREEAVLRFSTSLGRHSDLVEVKLPILDPGTRRREVKSIQVARDGELELDIPRDRIPGSAQLEVMVSSTMLSELRDSVDYLMGYPNGCIEQTTSRAYPLVVLEDLLPEIGVEVDKAKLEEFSRAGVKRLLSFQTSSGGLAYWPGSDEPHAFGTAFGLTALLEARARGYDVPERALAKMAEYLERSLRSGEVTESMPHGNMADGDTRALFVMTLGRLGRPQPGYLARLWREKDKLSAFGLSFLAVAASEGGGEGALLEPILAEIRERAVEEQTEAYFEGKRDGGWSMGSPLRTHAGALLAFASARPGHAMSPKLLSGLLARRRSGLWGNTQENVFGVMAVAESVAKGSGGKIPPVRLEVNGARRSLASAEKLSRRVRSLTLDEPALGLKEGAGGSQKVAVKNRGSVPLYVTARAEWEVPLTEKTMAPVKSGFEVERRYETLEGEPLAAGKIELGELVVVRLKVKSDGKRHYVAAFDRLPAGLEALNTDLATTQAVERRVQTKEEARGLAALSYSEVRDSRVSFYANELPRGTYEFTYLARATTAGRFLVPAAGAEAMYDPKAHGASAAGRVVIEE